MIGYGNWYYVPKTEGVMTQTTADGFVMALGQKYHVESSLATGTQTVRIGGALLLNDTKSDSIDTELPMYLFACNQDGAPTYAGKSRLYWMKLYQNGTLVRDFKPVRLKNGLVVLWDLVENKAYPAQSVSAPGNYTFFSAVGPDGERIYASTQLIIR